MGTKFEDETSCATFVLNCLLAPPSVTKVKSVAFALCSDDKETHKTPTTFAQKASDDGVLKSTERLNDRDAALAQLELEKRLALIKAWEENEKAKADNKAHKKLSAIAAWENTKKASVEAQLKQIERRQLPVRSSVIADVYVEEGRLPPLMLATHVDREEETVTTFSKSFLSFRICCSSTS
nr:remorin-like [Ipomoea batatas]